MNNQTKKTGRLNGGKNITMEQYVYLLKEYVMYASDLGHSDDMVHIRYCQSMVNLLSAVINHANQGQHFNHYFKGVYDTALL